MAGSPDLKFGVLETCGFKSHYLYLGTVLEISEGNSAKVSLPR